METSCLQIAFYLASWGMLRGSSFLLNKSSRFYERLLRTIVELDSRVWEIDVDSYSNDNLSLLMDVKNTICACLGEENRASDTLVTKIMLGIFGNVPAFDSFFQRGFDVGAFNKKHLKRIADFYNHHRGAIDAISVHTLDFNTGKETRRKYPKAKVIVMVGFVEGWR